MTVLVPTTLEIDRGVVPIQTGCARTKTLPPVSVLIEKLVGVTKYSLLIHDAVFDKLL